MPTFFHNTADLQVHLRLGETTEGLYLEFKETIDGFGAKGDPVKSGQMEVCRDITQFANHLGGCLLIGVRESSSPAGTKVASSLRSVERPDELQQWIEQAISNYCVPHTFTKYIDIIAHGSNTVVAINVPPSRTPIILWDRDKKTMECWRRTSHGKSALNPAELERLRMDTPRAAKIAFHEATQGAPQGNAVMVPDLYRLNGQQWEPTLSTVPVHFTSVTEASFQLQLTVGSQHPVIVIPYGLIRECWRDIHGRLALLLHLDLGILGNTPMFIRRS